MDDALNTQILSAHENEDFELLATLYEQAGGMAETRGEIDEACFFYTTAYVFALDTGQKPKAQSLHTKLVGYGREE